MYGKKSKIESDLVKLEEKKKALKTSYESEGNVITNQLTGTKSQIISKTQYDKTNREIGSKKKQLLKDAQNPFKNPAIVPITAAVQRINTFNLCNPFTMGINAAFPPGSPVSNAVKDVQAKLKSVQDIFRNFRIIRRE